MYNILLDLIIFISIFFLGFISLSGFGKLTVNENKYRSNNYFELQIFGSINLLIVGYSINLFFGTNYLINISIFSIGLFLYFFYKLKLNTVSLTKILILLSLVLTVVLISKTHEDFKTYHFFSIYEIFNNKIRLGVSNLNERFFHSSLLTFNQSLFVFPLFKYKFVHFPVVYIYISTLGYFFYNLFLQKKNNSNFFIIFCLIILLIKFNRLSEYGYDYISQFLLLIVFHKFYFQKLNFEQISTGLIFFVFAVLIRPISLFFLPFIFYILLSNKIDFHYYLIKNKIFMILILCIIMITTSFFRTGCLFYPVGLTCLSTKKISWSQKEFIKDYSNVVELWAKGFYHQQNTKYTPVIDSTEYKQNFNWVKFWFENHFFNKVFEFIIIVFAAYLITHIYFTKEKQIKKFNKNNLVLILFSIFSLFLWLMFLPQFRFGFSLIIIFIYLTLRYFKETNILFNKQKILRLFAICFLVLNLKNINRIQSELDRNDAHKFTNFPFFNVPELVFNINDFKIEKIFHTQIIKKLK